MNLTTNTNPILINYMLDAPEQGGKYQLFMGVNPYAD
jgi:hypothetical protein